jgi:predicted PilT family ATPase
LYFNLRLRPVNADQHIDINQRGKSELVIKDERGKAQGSSAYEKMQELQKLKDDGLISEEEYNAKRSNLLKDL